MVDLEEFAVVGRPIIFKVGSADVLAEFTVQDQILYVELAVIEKGGEGILSVLVDVIERSAQQRGIVAIEWSVYARNCSPPNPRLSKVLELVGFTVRKTKSGAEFYWHRKSTNQSLLQRSQS